MFGQVGDVANWTHPAVAGLITAYKDALKDTAEKRGASACYSGVRRRHAIVCGRRRHAPVLRWHPGGAAPFHVRTGHLDAPTRNVRVLPGRVLDQIPAAVAHGLPILVMRQQLEPDTGEDMV